MYKICKYSNIFKKNLYYKNFKIKLLNKIIKNTLGISYETNV